MMNRTDVTNAIGELDILLVEIQALVDSFTSYNANMVEVNRLANKAAKLGLGGLPAEFLRNAKVNDVVGVFSD